MSKLDELIKELCPNGVEYKRIDKICTISRGRVMSKEYIKDNEGIYPVYSSQTENDGELGKISTYDYEGEYLTWTTDGANAGSVFYRKGKFSITNVCGLLKVNKDNILPRYLYHSLKIETPKYVNKGMGNPKLMSNVMATIRLAVPPLEVQREIVRILDSFTLLTAELTAELTARKKQYEYYRNELLSNRTELCSSSKLSDIAEIYDGTHQTPEYKTEGIPFISVENINDIYSSSKYISVDAYNKYRVKPMAGDIFMTRIGSIGKCAIMTKDDDLAYYVSLALIRPNGNILDSRYLKHYIESSLGTKELSKRTLHNAVPIKINKDDIGKIIVKYPKLELQLKIADVLDNFDTICSDLNIGLPAEIEARKKQYEYYRDLLLTFAETGNIIATDRQTDRQTVIKLVQYVFGYAPVKLSEIATIVRGGNFQKKDFVASGRPCIHYGQMYTHFGVYADKTLTYVNDEVFNKSKIAQKGDIVMAVTSENVEDVCSCTAWLGDEKIAISGHTAIISHNQNAKYLSYFFHSKSFFEQKKRLAHGTKVIEVTPSKLGVIEILLPTIEEQERIVSILDRFDSLCNDISTGLPAEIEARKKQYEYYRDKLLSFK